MTIPERPREYRVSPETAGAVLATLRRHVGSMTWSEARKHLAGRRIAVNGILCMEEGRRVVAGDVLTLRTRALPAPPEDRDVQILFLDPHIVVAHKPSGMLSLRHPGDVEWSRQKKDRQPALEESLQRLIHQRERRAVKDHPSAPLLAVHRIDRETSGILVFARNEQAQQVLISQFAAHAPTRRYLCLIPGWIPAQTIRSRQIRDRGDGLRGSSADAARGRLMVTHLWPLRRIGRYSEVECRLETGRTNQIRIQLAELGHPIAGDVKYRGAFGGSPLADESQAPRLALHAAELGFLHPVSGESLHYSLPWPRDMLALIRRLQSGGRPPHPGAAGAKNP